MAELICDLENNDAAEPSIPSQSEIGVSLQSFAFVTKVLALVCWVVYGVPLQKQELSVEPNGGFQFL